MNNKFIKTDDSEIAKRLRNIGYLELNKEGSFYVFINDPTLSLKNYDKINVVYSDTLNL